MATDAKLGLLVGVALTVAAAFYVFPKDPAEHATLLPTSSATATATGGTGDTADRSPLEPVAVEIAQPLAASRGLATAAAARWNRETPAPTRSSSQPAPRRHRIAPGETLFSLARRYYRDGSRFVEIYQANRGVISNPENLPIGQEIVIP